MSNIKFAETTCIEELGVSLFDLYKMETTLGNSLLGDTEEEYLPSSNSFHHHAETIQELSVSLVHFETCSDLGIYNRFNG